jgi:hypothetical protein
MLIKIMEEAVGMDKAVECLSSKCKTLSSNPSTAKKVK